VETQPAPASPQAQPTADTPTKKKAAGKPTEVGAVWSNPAAPDALGGRRVKAARPQDAKQMASLRAGRFFVNDGRPTDIGEPKATRLVAAQGAR
jgi:hypothetical protein